MVRVFRTEVGEVEVNDGPFTDDMVRHWINVVKTQRGIIDYAEGMAQVLAEAGRASSKATGDPPSVAVEKWSNIIRERAKQILREGKSDGVEPKRLLKHDH
jgi:hypothetical protein